MGATTSAMADDENCTIVIDNGTGFLKCGFAGENFPSAMFPTMYGTPIVRSEEKMGEMELKAVMVGDECQEARSNLEVFMPITEGVVTDWDGMIHLWYHVPRVAYSHRDGLEAAVPNSCG